MLIQLLKSDRKLEKAQKLYEEASDLIFSNNFDNQEVEEIYGVERDPLEILTAYISLLHEQSLLEESE